MPRTVRLSAVSVTAIAALIVSGGGLALASVQPEVEDVTIPQIQGALHLSPYDGKEVTTTGVVTAAKYDGYWLQDPKGDGNDATSDGVFVYTGKDGPKPESGQTVTVKGTVDEFRPGSKNGPNLNLTEIVPPKSDRATFTVAADQLPMPEPILVGPGGREAPAQQADGATERTDVETAEFLPDRDAVDFYETFEGMLVEVRDAEAVGPTTSYGEIDVVPGGTEDLPRTTRGGVRYTGYDKPNTRRITVDDEIIYKKMPKANVGDRLSGSVTGPTSYDFGTVRLYPTAVPEVKSGDLQREKAEPASAKELSVATFNVENLDPTDPPEKFDALAGTVVENLGAPDVVALEEVQDNTGAECPDGGGCQPDGVVDADKTLDQFVAAIEAKGGPTYKWTQISPENLADGGEPTGNIRAAFLYRTDRDVKLVERPGGNATTPTDVVEKDDKAALTLSPGRIAPTDEAWKTSRKPLAAEFTWKGKTVFLVANHFNSKGGDEPILGRWQPPTRESEQQRNAQATLVHDFVAKIRKIQKNANVVVLGDINDFEFSKTTEILEGGGVLYDLVRDLPDAERYSYVYQGNSQVLDHILVSPQARKRVQAYDIVHVNAEFADQASDHDPQVMRLTPR